MHGDGHTSGIHQGKGPHANAKDRARDLINIFYAAEAFFQQACAFIEPGDKKAVDGKAGRILDDDRYLAVKGIEINQIIDQAALGLRTGDDLHQLVLGRMIEIMDADNSCRMFGALGNVADQKG